MTCPRCVRALCTDHCAPAIACASLRGSRNESEFCLSSAAQHRDTRARYRRAIAATSTTPPVRPIANPVGFMRVSRGQLSLTGAVFACLLAVVPALPSSAAPVDTSTSASKVGEQKLVVEETPVPDVARSSFTSTNYSDVQAPIPMTTPISSPFGFRIPPCAGCSSNHLGVDLTPGAGYAVEAIADGVVSAVGNPSGGLGVYIVIDHVIDGKKVSSVYAHMALGSMHYAVGDRIERGDVVGAVGSTGQSTGPHLYFAIRIDGVTPTEPMTWLRNHITTK